MAGCRSNAKTNKNPPWRSGGILLSRLLGCHFAGAGAGAGAGAAFGIGAGAGAGAAPLVADPSTTVPLPHGSQQPLRGCRRRANKLVRPHGSQLRGAHELTVAHGAGAHAGFGAQHVGLGGQQWSPVPLIASSKTILCIVVSSKVDLHPRNYFEYNSPPRPRVPTKGHTLWGTQLRLIMIGGNGMSRQIEGIGQNKWGEHR